LKERENKPQTKSQKSGEHPKYQTYWREPKFLVIYTVDENGKKEKKSRIWLDATLQGPDHASQLLCAHLHRLGVVYSKSVTFIADGALWIGERFEGIVKQLSLPKEKATLILDFFHASHPISIALGEMMNDDSARQQIYRELLGELRQSRWKVVVERLQELGGK
jgi:hypothetical protein